MRLTERDRAIVRDVARHRFLRSSHITALIGGSAQQVLRRLQLLYHHGYLERPREQIDYYHQGGSQRIVYGLGRQGTVLMRARTRCYRGNNSPVKRLFLEHTLMVADIMVAFELSCRQNGTHRLRYEDDLHSSTDTAPKDGQFKWTVKLDGTEIGIIPDRVFALDPVDANGPQRRIHFFLEADRATMPVTRKTYDRTSFGRKLAAYEATWAQDIHREQFGISRFRVLTVTPNSSRTANLAEAARNLNRGHGLFLFTEEQSLKTATDVLALSWKTPFRGRTERLI